MKIAIIGGGISGLGAAYLLNPFHQVQIYEKNGRIGGHSRTISLRPPGSEQDIPVDTGFIAFNYLNYPHLSKLFQHLEIPVAKSHMSFGVSIDQGRFEYGTQNWHSLFSHKRYVANIFYLKMLLDLLRFNRTAGARIQQIDQNLSLGQFLDRLEMGKWFRQYYLLPMGSAIWSAPAQEMLDYPATTFLNFFENHGLLTVNKQPQWYTVQGGSIEYLKRLTHTFQDRIQVSAKITAVRRKEEGIEIIFKDGELACFDTIIFATPADQTLKLIENPSQKEQDILSPFRFQPNRTVTHHDVSFMPKRKRAWSSWNYLSNSTDNLNEAVGLTYWMNNLQPLKTRIPTLVTLNPKREIRADLMQDIHDFRHPLFDHRAVDAQSKIDSIQGENRSYFCGAWQGYGFHEDGLKSAVKVAKIMGIDPPW